MKERTLHYIIRGKTRCGAKRLNGTTVPENVTCGNCKRLLEREVK